MSKQRLARICATLGLMTTMMQAVAEIHWEGMQGAAVKAPQISAVSAPDNNVGIQGIAVTDGVYQSLRGTFSSPIDLTHYAGVEFYFKHGHITKQTLGFVVRFDYEGTHRNIIRSVISTSPDWQKIYLPFDVDSWQASSGNAVRFGKATCMRLWPYQRWQKAGQYLAIAGVHFVPRSQAAVKGTEIKILHTFLHAPPTDGNRRSDSLVDGNVKVDSIWRHYSDDPDVEFDLGGSYTIDRIEVHSNGAPSHNFADVTVLAGFDRAALTPTCAIANKEQGVTPRHVVYAFEPRDTIVAGRYFRFKFTRPRSDFSVNLAEVKFFGHTPSSEELAAATSSSYSLGPKMPQRSDKDYLKYQQGPWTAWISRTNGVLNGVLYQSKLIVERMVPQYMLQSRKKDVPVNGYDDKVVTLRAEGDAVIVQTVNDKLPGLVFERCWRVEDGAFMEKVTVINREMKERLFLRIATDVVLVQAYRASGYYELPGTTIAAGMIRLPANEVRLDKAITHIPTIAFENGKERQTLWHTRFRFNDRFTYMDLASEEENLQLFTSNGWRLASATIVPADSPRQSFENRFSVTNGGMLKAYEDYITALPVASYRAQIKRPAWLRDARAGISIGWDGSYPQSMKRYLDNCCNLFSPRGYLIDGMLIDLDGIWGELPTSGWVRGWFGNRQTADEVRQKIAFYRHRDPRFKVGLYTWFWSAHPWSSPVVNHPEWFISHLRNGAKASWFPGYNVNYLRLFGIKESRDEARDQIVNAINWYDQDLWYLDGGHSGTYAKDWDTMRIDSPLGQTDFFMDVRKSMKKDHPNRVVFFNDSGNPLGDFGFLESFGGSLTSEWRRGAIIMWKFKLYAWRDPRHHSVYIYWLPGVNRAMCNYMSGIGVLPAFHSRQMTGQDLPFIAARYEVRQAQLTDAAVVPDWRFDPKEELECMALRQNGNGWVYMQYHGKQQVRRKVSVNLPNLGLNQPGKPVYAWLYSIRDAKTYKSIFSEPQVAEAYQQCGWVSERALTSKYLGAFPYQKRFTSEVSIRPEEGKVLMLSQTPAVVLSIEGEPSHYRLSGQPGLDMSGDRESLHIENEYKRAEVGIMVPDGMLPVSAQVNGKTCAFDLRQEGTLLYVVVPVDKGSSTIAMTWRKGVLPEATQLRVERLKRTLKVTVEPQDSLVEIRFEGNTVLSHQGSFELTLPKTIRDGSYLVTSGKLSRKLSLKGLGERMRIKKLLPRLPARQTIKTVQRMVRGIKVLQEGEVATEGASYAKADSGKGLLTAGSLRHYESHFNVSAAGFECKVQRYLHVRFHNGMMHHNTKGYDVKQHYIRPSNVNNYGGLMIDFETPNGYTMRCAAGLGMQKEKRISSEPSWGAKKVPDFIGVLNDGIHEDRLETFDAWIDLHDLGAPADWTGTIWLSMVLQNIGPDRSFGVELLETANRLPAAVEVLKPIPLKGVSLEKTLSVPLVKGKPDWSEIPPLGELGDKPGVNVPVKTIVKAAYDDHNLYLHYDCREIPGRILTCEMGRRGYPWFGDGIEAIIQRIDKPDQMLHLIIDAEGNKYAEYIHVKNVAGSKKQILMTFPATFKNQRSSQGWTTDVMLPWKALGSEQVTSKPLGFNMMRNRLQAGNTENFTLVPGGKYFTGTTYRIECSK